MEAPTRQTLTTVLVGLACVALLITLGTLQYSWIDQVSQGERDRRQNQLADAAFRLSQDIDSELLRLQLTFQRRGVRTSDLETSIRTAYERWESDQIYGDLLKEVWSIRAEDLPGPGLNVRRFDPETGELEATDWPPHLSHLRERIERTRENLPQLPERGWSPFDGKAPSLLVPLVGGDGRSRRGANPIFHLLVVVLDADFLRGVFFPDLVSRHFGGSTQNEFRIWIRDAESQQKKFEWPQESDELIPARVDVRQPLFLLRNPREFGSGQRGRGAGFGRGRRVRPPGPPRGPVAGRGAGAERVGTAGSPPFGFIGSRRE